VSSPSPPLLYKAIVCVDIEGFGDSVRNDEDRVAMRKVLYHSLERAFAESGIPDGCYSEDRGDGAFFLIPPDRPQALVEPLPFELAAELGRHNQDADAGTRLRLRVAMHVGYVRHDSKGVVSDPLNRAFGLLDSPELKAALRNAPGNLAFIASAEFFREIIRPRQGFDPSAYREARVTGKRTETDAWICTSDVQIHAGQEYGKRVSGIDVALASVGATLEKARQDRDVTVGKISSPVPDVPDLVPEMRRRLAALDRLRKQRRWAELISVATELERATGASLTQARAAHRAIGAPLRRREELRGLLGAYQVAASRYAEHPRLVELYQRAYDLLWTAPCDLPKAEAATMRYVRAVQEGPDS
jgi:hypothetical protein